VHTGRRICAITPSLGGNEWVYWLAVATILGLDEVTSLERIGTWETRLSAVSSYQRFVISNISARKRIATIICLRL